MNYKTLRILIFSAAVSLLGVLVSQSVWLKNTFNLAERQFDHRADQMLNDVVDELKMYADTSSELQDSILHKTCIFDVVDTVLLEELIVKYNKYHQLDSAYSYALVTTAENNIIYRVNDYSECFEAQAHKVCLSCVWHEEYIHLSIYFPNKEKYIIGKHLIWIALSILFTLLLMSAFAFIVHSLFKQKKIAEIKNDFVNNMTHELKTPLSTISVASEMLIKLHATSEDKRLKKYSKVIFDENQRMRKLVDKVLGIATFEKGEITIEKEDIDIHSTICKMIESFCFETCKKKVEVDYRLDAEDTIVNADILHLRNILNNLIDNAVKYSGDEPKLSVITENIKDYFIIRISDKGKGIPKESLNKVFEKFYRVPSGNIHNVKGFGLGLFYVKTMVESHGGYIEINSTINKGTTVSVFFPQ